MPREPRERWPLSSVRNSSRRELDLVRYSSRNAFTGTSFFRLSSPLVLDSDFPRLDLSRDRPRPLSLSLSFENDVRRESVKRPPDEQKSIIGFPREKPGKILLAVRSNFVSLTCTVWHASLNLRLRHLYLLFVDRGVYPRHSQGTEDLKNWLFFLELFLLDFFPLRCIPPRFLRTAGKGCRKFEVSMASRRRTYSW